MLTVSLWLLSFLCIAIAMAVTKHWEAKFMRLMFCLMIGLSVWVTSVYIFWLTGFELQVGTIENGKMNDQWWLPSVVIFWTVLTYVSGKNKQG
jgi:hypothetical protein